MITIKNVIFDLGGVILKDKPISVLKKLNISDETYDTLKTFFSDWKELDLGNKTLEEKYNECKFSKEIDALYKDYLLNYYKYREINIELINLIERLKKKNYKVYILSDNNKESYDYYKNNELFKNIDGWVLSCEYHTVKKEGKIFNILLDRFNLKANECYFIDDNVDNIMIGKEYGINGYVFNESDNMQILEEL